MRLMRSVGRYEILREVGRGGMAMVYLARQTDLDRFVALKELAAFHASDGSFAERFLRESRVAGSLSHPNIVTVHDYFEHDGTPYIAMEYVERGSLRRHVGNLTLAQIGGVLEGLLAALAHAEQHGVVHRDVKPENLLITADGRIKVTDFGIAKALQYRENNVTATGTTVGTPTYMAPEQAMAQDIGPWTDLYSVGCIAFELFTGKPPFHDSDAPMAILLRHVNEPIPLINSIDPGLADWVGRLLVKDPRERTQSAGAAWDEFEEIVIGLLGPRWRRQARIGSASDGTTYLPLTAAPLETATPEPDESAEFESFAWEAAPVEAAERLETPGPLATPPPMAAPAPAPYHPETGFVTFGGPQAAPEPPSQPPAAVSAGTPFSVPLIRDFQYMHGPLMRDEGGLSLLGNREIVDALKERLRHSRGGSFLITGFRGVGKTTVMLRALEELAEESEDALEYLPVVLSVARPLTVDQLLFEVVRRLFEALTDGGVLDSLQAEIRQALLLAYARTSMAFKETSSRSRETSQSLTLDLAGLGPAGAAMSVVTPKVGLSRKRADTLAREASFLAYSHADVEHDFLRILALLDASATVVRPHRRRFKRVRPRRPPWRGRLVVVLDELDKLTSTPAGIEAVDNLLMGLKNLLTARNVHFVFVGGPELHDAFMRDVARGNSVYESVFATHFYVPCLWRASGDLVGALTDGDEAAGAERLGDVIDYFDFKARGIPRLLLRELNSFVRWVDGAPRMAIGELDAARVAFYADIQRAVTEFVDSAVEREVLGMPIDRDRWRLGAYYITDWILRRGVAEFTVADILADDATPSPLMHASAERVEKLIRHLRAHRIVEKVWYQDARHTMIGDAAQVNSYRLSPAVVDQLATFAHRSERERAALRGGPAGSGMTSDGRALAAPTPWATGADVVRLKQGRYELGDLIGVGGVGRVYRALDRGLNREVAVKMLAPHLLGDRSARGRWRRESEIAMKLEHRHIVRTYDVVDDDRDVAAIVMELVEGPSLREVLPLTAPAAVAVTDQLLSALACAQAFGLARFDLKPENIVFRDADCAVIVDLGLVKRIDPAAGDFHTMAAATSRPLILGTPAYMSPEQVLGGGVDIRSDLYCLGLVLYETMVGRPLRDIGGTPTDILLHAVSDSPMLAELDVSEELRAVLKRALATDVDERFASPEEMQAALLDSPEGLASREVGPDELLLPREMQPARDRLAVMPSVPGPDLDADVSIAS